MSEPGAGRVLVTGGSAGIGLGIARALRGRGHEVVITGRRSELLQRAAQQIGAHALCGDVTDDPEGLVRAAGPLQHLVNNAGHTVHAPVGQWSAEVFQRMFAVHVTAPALLAQAFAAQADGPGCIVNIASTLAQRPAPGATPYGAAKAGMVALTRQLALELAPRGLRAVAVLPGVVPTAMTREASPDSRVHLDRLTALHPLGRLGTVEDVADMVLAMLDATWVTGVALPVDGGLLIRE